MSISEYVRLLQRRWKVVVAAALLVLIATGAFVISQRPLYQTSTTLIVSATTASTLSDLSQGASYTQQAVQTYAELARSPLVLDVVAQDLNLSQSGAALASQITTATPTGTAVLEISVSDRNPSVAARIANRTATSLTEAVDIVTPTAGGEQTIKVTQIAPALTPRSPISPKPVIDLALGALVGLTLGLLMALIIDKLDSRIRLASEVDRITGVPLVGSIYYDKLSPERPLVLREEPNSPEAEAFRTLRTNLQFLQLNSRHKEIVFTSSVAGEGKSTTVCNLALALAAAGQRVMLIDADLRRPRIASLLGLDGSVGLTDVLIGQATIGEAKQTWADTELCVLPAGTLPPNPSEILQTPEMEQLLQGLRRSFDYVLIDAPPLLPVADAAILARRTSGALMICALGRVSRSQLTDAVSNLTRVEARVLGAIATMVPAAKTRDYAYKYGYGNAEPEALTHSAPREAAAS